MTYGEKIAHLRKARGMTQEELGKVLSVTYQAVSKWERGESLPDFNMMSRIAKFFEVPLGYFEEGGENIEQEKSGSPAEPASSAHENNIIGTCTKCGRILWDGDDFIRTPKLVCSSCLTAHENNHENNIIGTCTKCGRMLRDGDDFTQTPELVCSSCLTRIKREEESKQRAKEEHARYEAERETDEQLGGGANAKLIVCLVLAVVAYIVLTVCCFTVESDREFIAALLTLVPLAVFAIPSVIIDFINDLRDKDDDEGYKLWLSLIVGGVFAVINIIIYIILASSSDVKGYYYGLMAIGAVVSFTFISQYMWGSCVRDIFTCGGFTFKLPGFIFSLTVESVIMMILIKIFLGILAAIVFIITTVLFAVVAMLGSVFTFIPCIVFKSVKDKLARNKLKTM